MRDAIVIGGGIAGMSAAWRLRHSDVLVLEGSNRIGGRLRSEGRHVGGEHRAEHLQRIFTRRKPRDGELHEKQHDRHAEDHRDQFHEDVQHPDTCPGLRYSWKPIP